VHQFATASALSAGAFLLTAGATPDAAATVDDAMFGRAESPASSEATREATREQTPIHQFAVDYHHNDFESLISSYLASGQKVWIAASATIDGVTYEHAGLRLAGDSLTPEEDNDENAEAVAERPGTLQWLVRLDMYVAGQSHFGATDFAVQTDTGLAWPVVT
jgi:spore coat protein CotH